MNAAPRTRRLTAALGALVLLTVGACSSADETITTSSGTTSSVATTAATDTSDTTGSATSAAPDATGTDATGTDGSAPATTGADAPATGPASIEPAPTTDVPAPGGGDINQTVAAVVVSTAPAVPLTQPASFGSGVQVQLGTLAKIDTVAQGPGEISGPGLSVPVTITNTGGAAIALDAVNVTMTDAAGSPGAPMTGAPAAPFSGALAAGASATATYVFALPGGYTDPATIGVSYAAGAPVVQFSGATG